MHDGDVPIYRILDLDLLSKACSQHANYGWGCKIYEREHSSNHIRALLENNFYWPTPSAIQ